MVKVILSDIHGNIPAFLAVLEELSTLDHDGIICAGDIVGYGSSPGECIELVRANRIKTVKGNHDAASVDLSYGRYFNEWAKKAIIWTAGRLCKPDKDFLKKLPYVIRSEGFTVAHGTLHRPEEFRYMLTAADAAGTFAVMDTRVCFVGHSHVPGVFTLGKDDIRFFPPGKTVIDSGSRYIVNAGSVGQPRDNDPRACYCVFDSEKGEFDFRRVEYDVRAAREGILQAGLPRRLGDRLLKGR